MKKKYEMVKDGNFYRIRALRDVNDTIRKGDIGGYIEKEENLSQEGTCWIGNNAAIYEDAKVFGNATVFGDAQAFGSARIHGDAEVEGDARIYDEADVFGNVLIKDFSQVHGTAILNGNVRLKEGLDVSDRDSVICIGPIGSRFAYTTFVKQSDGIYVICGCFFGRVEDFEKKVIKTHKNTKYEKQYLEAVKYVKILFA